MTSGCAGRVPRPSSTPRPGGIYRVHIRAGVTASGQFVEVEPYRRVVFTWGFEIPDHPIPPGSTLVQTDLIPDGDDTLVRLTQDHVPPPGVVPVRRGWDDYLDRLQVAAAGGDPGPDPGGVPQPTQGA
ncbi:MAG TPA: SRPBCC domain-containing protein [Actinomycetes bacterium]|nr:SRPBCC domain-containing protein [Actinomycetes bacterium]